MDIDFAASSLRSWINPRHLSPEAMADLAERFAASPERYHYIDDFLLPDRLPALRQVLLEDGHLEPVYKLYSRTGWVSEEEFNRAPQSDRFIAELIYRRPKPGREMARSVLTELLFRREIRASHFHAWLSAITGQPVNGTDTINLKLLDSSHMLHWHNDIAPNRSLCMVLYLHDDWVPDYEGHFLMRRLDGGVDAVEPRGNRLLYFVPHAPTKHAVEPIAKAAGHWPRLNYTVWFSFKATRPAP